MKKLSYISHGEWVMLPIEMLRALSRRSELLAYKCNQSDVMKPRCRVIPNTAQPTKLSFSAWRLAHAVKKADCARWASFPVLQKMSFGFLLENAHLFNWNPKEFGLRPNMSEFYADFSRTGLSGRIGQGMALLLLENKKYRYIGNFSNIYGNFLKKSNAKSINYPDFVVENNHNGRALIEAKGSFVSPNYHRGIKDKLKQALKQLDGWDKLLSPCIHENFAVGTFLQEAGNRHKKSSCIAFVNTKPQTSVGVPEDPADLPPDAIRRDNYASWLSLMGFDDAAGRLRERRSEREQRRLWRLTLKGRKYDVVISSIQSSYRHPTYDPYFWHPIGGIPSFLFGRLRDDIKIGFVGLDSRVMDALRNTLTNHDSQALMNIELEDEPEEQGDIHGELGGGEFYASVFSDGSLIGEISISDGWRLDIEQITVDL